MMVYSSQGSTLKRVVAAAVGLLFCAALAPAQEEILGKWDVEMDFQGQMVQATLTIMEKDEALSGTWEGQRGASDLDNVKFEDGKLTFSRSVNFQDQEFDLSFEGSIKDGKLVGGFDTPMGMLDTVGTRPGAGGGSTQEVGLAGEWNLLVEVPDGTTSETTLTITDDDGNLSGLWSTDLGDVEFPEIKVDGENIEFAAEADMGGILVPLSFKGTVNGSELVGSLSLTFEGQEPMEMPIKGTKAGGAAPEAEEAVGGLTGEVHLVGQWELEAELPDGTTSLAEMIVTEEDGVLVATLTTEIGEGVINGAKVDGNNLEFETEIDMGGIKAPVSFIGTTGGDLLEGTLTLDMEGQLMEMPIKGKKIAGGGPVDLPGTWDVEVELPDGTTSLAEMTIEESDAGLVGLLSTEIGDAKIEGIVVDGNNISYKAEIDMGGISAPVELIGTASGDTIEGSLTLDMEGQIMEMTFKAKKVGGAESGGEAAEEPEIALSGEVNLPGTWEVEAELPDGTTSISEMVITEVDGKLSAVLTTEIGEGTIEEIHVDGNSVHYKGEIDMGGIGAPFEFVGSTGGDKMVGTFKLDMDGQEMELGINAIRTAEPALSGDVSLPGTWEIEVELPDGTTSIAEFIITEKDGKLTATLSTEIGEGTVDEILVDGNNISYKGEIDMGGEPAPFEFVGTTGGDKLRGTFKLDMGGQEMEMATTGTRTDSN